MENEPTLYYVEDEPLSRQVMELLLTRRLGYKNVTIVEDSKDFIARLEALPTPPDVVFLDIHVTPYNGFEMLQMLREHEGYRDTIVIALTASVMNEEVEMLQEAGFDGCLAKPLDHDEFPTLLEMILAGEYVWSI